jgi:hypothetical protein
MKVGPLSGRRLLLGVGVSDHLCPSGHRLRAELLEHLMIGRDRVQLGDLSLGAVT